MRLAGTVRAVALFEGAKGGLVLLVGFGALAIIHHDVQQIAEDLLAHLHLNPASHYPRIFLDAVAHLTDPRLWFLATMAGVYATVRFVEAYGLWRGLRWAEWFAAVSDGIYIPFEIYELLKSVTWIALGALLTNVLVVGLMVSILRRKRAANSAY
jgi:uncharacterized membrane protein (DUF2068 family)